MDQRSWDGQRANWVDVPSPIIQVLRRCSKDSDSRSTKPGCNHISDLGYNITMCRCLKNLCNSAGKHTEYRLGKVPSNYYFPLIVLSAKIYYWML